MMSHSTYPETDHDSATLQLELGGRRFPEAWHAIDEDDPVPARRIAELPATVDLPARMTETIWDRLVWNNLGPEEPDRQVLVESYINSLQQLSGFRTDVEKLVRAACVANLEFRQGSGPTHVPSRDEALKSKLDEMLKVATAEWLPPSNLLSGQFASQEIATLRPQLEQSLRASVRDFAKNVFELLARLVDRQLIGLVEWLPNHCCNYHFFKQVVIQENAGTSTTYSDVFRNGDGLPSHAGRNTDIGRRTSQTETQGTHVHRLARHEHGVMNAIRTSIGNSRVIVPPAIQQMLKDVPDWLYPFVEVIDGDILRERIIECDVKVEKWSDVEVRDEPIFGWEPAVIIGPYVLTGWGPREVNAELERRQRVASTGVTESNQQATSLRYPLFVAAAVGLAMASMLLLMGTMSGWHGPWWPLIASVACVVAIWRASFDYFTSRRHPQPALPSHWIAAGLACQFLAALWLVARWFVPMTWVIPVALIIVSAIAIPIGKRLARAT